MPVARFASSLSAEWLERAPVRVGPTPPHVGTPERYVIVASDHGEPLLRCDVYRSEQPECFAFEEVRIWKNWLVIGFGESLHLVGLAEEPSISIALGGYFGHLYPRDECLLVASCDDLFRIEPDGSVKWRSRHLGLDGVIVDRVEGDIIEGHGEWNPPGGWNPFRLSLESGARP